MSRTSILTQLSKFPLICIYLLIDEPAGNAFLQWSNGNAVNQLSNTITLLRRGIHDNVLLQNAYNRGSLKLKVLKEYEHDQPEVVMRANAIMLFKKSGYTDMTSKKLHRFECKLRKRVLADYRDGRKPIPLVYVTLKSKAIGGIVCGVFDNMIEADTYMKSFRLWDTIEFMDNHHTREFHKSIGYVVKKS